MVLVGLDLRKQFIWGRLKNISFGLLSLLGGGGGESLVIHLAISKKMFLYKPMKKKQESQIVFYIWFGLSNIHSKRLECAGS